MTEKKFDYILFMIVIILMSIGVVMIYSASAIVAQELWNQSHLFLKKQLIWFVLSVAVILVVSRIHYHHWKYFTFPAVFVSLILLAFVLTQDGVHGSRRWIPILSYTVQPSEFFKYALVMLTAFYLSRKKEMLNSLKELIWPWGVIVAIGISLILMEPDLGMVLVVFSTALVMLFMAGMKFRYLTIGVILPIALVAFMVLGLDYKPQRLVSFFSNESSVSNEAYQVNQSIMAIGSGGVLGKGIGRGSAKLMHLPESHTDFIISNLAEEGGFAMVSFCLALYFIIIVRGLRIASLAQDQYGFFLAFGIVTVLAINIVINIGVATKMLPTTGMTLPFMSYGGSSVLCSSFGVGVLLNISRHQCRVSKIFERKKQ